MPWVDAIAVAVAFIALAALVVVLMRASGEYPDTGPIPEMEVQQRRIKERPIR
jgi:hypothetical protein